MGTPETSVAQARHMSAARRAEGEVESIQTPPLAGASAPGWNVSMAEDIAGVEEREASLIHNSSSSSSQQLPQERPACQAPSAEPVRIAELAPDVLNSTVEVDQTTQESGAMSIDQTSIQANDRAEGHPNNHAPPLQVSSEGVSYPHRPEPASTQSEITNRFAEYMARVEARRAEARSRRQERLARLDEMLDQIALGMGSSAGGASLPSEADIDANTTTFTWTGPEDATCTICIEDLAPGAEVRRLRCGHVYHRECVDAWLRRSRSCCLCKQAIDSSD